MGFYAHRALDIVKSPKVQEIRQSAVLDSKEKMKNYFRRILKWYLKKSEKLLQNKQEKM